MSETIATITEYKNLIVIGIVDESGWEVERIEVDRVVFEQKLDEIAGRRFVDDGTPPVSENVVAFRSRVDPGWFIVPEEEWDDEK